MSSIIIFQVILNGLVMGLMYSLTAAGFSLIYGQAGILFFALGEVYMLGAIITYVLNAVVGVPYIIAVAIAAGGLGIFGVLLERYFFHFLERENALTYAVASLALGMLIAGIALEIFGEQGKAIEAPVSGVLNIYGVILTRDKLLVIVIALLIISFLHLFFKFTKIGMAVRAVSQDEDAAQLVGVSLAFTKALSFFLALSTAGAAGGLIAPLFYVDAFMAGPTLMTTLIVVVLGGLGSFVGAISGGLFIGLVQSFGYTFVGGITSLITFVVTIIVLLVKPEGLFGHE